MLKQLLVLMSLFLAIIVTPLCAGDLFDDFINTQINIETQFLDHNLSSENVEKLVRKQDRVYRSFFLALISSKEKAISTLDIYADEIASLQRRMKINKQQNNTKAYMRDEIKLNTYDLLQKIRQTFFDLIQASESDNEAAFNQKIDEIVTRRHDNEVIIDKEKYPFVDDGDDISISIKENLLENQLVLNIHNAISSELVRYKEPIYDAVRLSSFGLVSLGYKINTSTVGKTLNEYISWSGLDSAKVVLIMMILLAVYSTRKIVVTISGNILKNFFEESDDISYIIRSISGVFSVIMIVITLDVVLKIYAGFTDILIIDKIFNITYTVLITFLVYRFVNAIAVIKMEHFRRSEYLRHEVINLGIKVINVIIYIIGFIVILNFFNVDLSAILSGLGIGGFAMAFAAKDTLSNFFGSVSILMGNLFEQGDWIEVDGYEGTVVEIGLRATTIRTFDNAMIAIPNFKLADNGLKNWSQRQLGRRIKMHIGVTYESDFNDIRNAVNDIREMLCDHEGISHSNEDTEHVGRSTRLVSLDDYKGIKRNVLVYMDQFSNSSIDILVYCFSKSVVWNEWLEVKEDVMYKIAAILEKNNLSFAYPAMTLHYTGDEKKVSTESKEITA